MELCFARLWAEKTCQKVFTASSEFCMFGLPRERESLLTYEPDLSTFKYRGILEVSLVNK